jgi:hypothetical protein
MPDDQIGEMLTEQENRWWSIKVQCFSSVEHFLGYAGRYIRRPPIAQHRISYIGDGRVKFWCKDKRQQRRVLVECSLQEFVDRWAQHVPERYQHAVRSFGLFSPRALGQTSAAVFVILGQNRRPLPKRRRWADSLKRDFGHDPLLSQTGERMKWVRRVAPQVS